MTEKEKLEFVLGDGAEDNISRTENGEEPREDTARQPEKSGRQPFFACIIPWKGDSAPVIALKTFSLLLLIFSLIWLKITYDSYSEFNSEQAAIAAAAKAEAQRDPAIRLGAVGIPDPEIPEAAVKKKPKILDEYKELYKINNDLIGYLSIEGTMVDYPVVQVKGFDGKVDMEEVAAKNNEYLHKDFYSGDYLFAGTIFADYRAVSDENGRAANTVIYGHNMAAGTMFADVVHYDPHYYGDYGVNFYKEHPVINYDTIYEKGRYKIFAAMQQNVNTSEGDVFYYTRTYKFDNEKQFVDYYGKVLDRSMFYNPDVDLRYGDEVIALSTCDFSTFPDKAIRFVLYARRVRDGESPEVDVSKYYVNDDPLFYDYYYEMTGTQWGGRKWPAALLKNSQKYKAGVNPAAQTSA